MQNARTVILSPIFTVVSLLSFAVKVSFGAYLCKQRRGLYDTCYIDKRPSEKVQNARIITISQVITK